MQDRTMSLFDLFERIETEESAEQFFVNARWPNGLRCAFCNGDNVYRGKHPTQPYHCRDCRSPFSVKSNTVMSDSKLSYKHWLVANYMVNTNLKGISALQLQHHLKVTYKSAWHLEGRIREAMSEDGTFQPFDGPVEVDETFIGGRKRNQPKERRKRLSMIPVIGAIDRATDKIRLRQLGSRKGDEMKAFVYGSTEIGSEVNTDSASGYRGMFARIHKSINHKAGEYGPTNRIESVWAQIKRSYKGTYHKISPRHLHRYLDEYMFRHNHRGESDIQKMEAVVKGGDGKRLRLRELLGHWSDGKRKRRRRDARLDWVVESAEGDILETDLTRTEAVSEARKLAESGDKPISAQNIYTGEEIVYLPDGTIERHPPTSSS